MELVNKLVSHFPKLSHYKPGLEFLARLSFFGAGILLLKSIHNYFADSHGVITVSDYGSFSPTDMIRQTLLYFSHKILLLLGEEPFIGGWNLGIPGGQVSLQTPCLGINICFAFILLVLAYPKNIRITHKLIFIIAGLLIIQTFNLLRIVGMVYVVKYRLTLPIEHHDLFNLVIYCSIFLLFYFYTNHNLKPKSNNH